jgi:hypothetical protein
MDKKETLRGYKGLYKDENGYYCKPANEKTYYKLGEEYKYPHRISLCQSGFHFCENIIDVFKYYPLVQWSVIAEIEASGEILKGDDKSVTDTIKIVNILSFEDINSLVNCRQGANYSRGINDSYGVNEGCGVNGSKGINGGYGINRGYGINCSQEVNDSRGVNRGYGINGSQGVSNGYGINGSQGVSNSYGINGGCGVNGSYGVFCCSGISNRFFAANIPQKFFLFDREISKERYNDVFIKFRQLSNNFIPQFNNLRGLYLKNGSKWEFTPVQAARSIQKEEAWKDLPVEAIEYLQSLPEFNADIFFEVTGISV